MKYLYLACGLLLIFGLGLKINSSRFTEIKMEQMVSGQSKYTSLGDDPCFRQVTGDPIMPDKRRIRVDFVCPDGLKVNTISFSSIPNTMARTVLWEIGRIDKFNSEIVYKNWRCSLNGQILNLETVIKEDEEIKCEKV